MTEPSSRQLYCRSCNKEIFRKKPVGRIPSQCADCRYIDVLRRAREYEAKTKAGYTPPSTFVCMDCKQEFPRDNLGPLLRRCPGCWQENEDQRSKRRRDERYEALRVQFETLGRWTKCERCQADIRCVRQKGPAPRWCDPCRNERKREMDKVARPWARAGVCIMCGGPTDRKTRDQRRHMCTKCFRAGRDPDTGRWINKISRERQSLALKFGAAAVRERGEWGDRWIALDIWERDGWICQICRKPVDPELRDPDPECPTIDHVIPRVENGTDAKANVRLAHGRCNSARSNRGGNEQLALLSV